MRNAEKDELEMTARRELMLSEGFRLFSEKGIDPVSMQEVADACGVGIATLYRYFNTKLALVIAIGTRKWEEYSEFAMKLRNERHVDKMTAAEEFSFFLDFFIDLYQNHRDLLKFNQGFNNFVKHEGATKEQLAPYIASINLLGVFFHSVYEKGKLDGTVRTDLPEGKMFAASCHIMIAVGVRYAQGLLFSADNESDRTEEYLLLKKMMIDTFTKKP